MKPITFRSMDEAQSWMIEHGRGKTLHLFILHDDGCPKQKGWACACHPDYVVEELTAESYERGERGQRDWLRGGK